MTDLITRLPKTELHVHIEGTLEPEMMFQIATRNGLLVPFEDVDEVQAAYQFDDLQSFLDIYYQGGQVLRASEDFYDLMSAYLDRAATDGVRHAEIFFDPQSHTGRGVGFEVFMRGFRDAISDAGRRLLVPSSDRCRAPGKATPRWCTRRASPPVACAKRCR